MLNMESLCLKSVSNFEPFSADGDQAQKNESQHQHRFRLGDGGGGATRIRPISIQSCVIKPEIT